MKQLDLPWGDENWRFTLAASGETTNRRLTLAPIQGGGNERQALLESSFVEARSPSLSPQRRLLTAAEVAHFLSISTRQVWRLADSGTLPGRVKLGHLTRWRQDVIEKWVAAGCPAKRQR